MLPTNLHNNAIMIVIGQKSSSVIIIYGELFLYSSILIFCEILWLNQTYSCIGNLKQLATLVHMYERENSIEIIDKLYYVVIDRHIIHIVIYHFK